MFPGLLLSSTEPVHYPDNGCPVGAPGGKPPPPVFSLFFFFFETLVCRGRGSNPRPPAHEADGLTTRPPVAHLSDTPRKWLLRGIVQGYRTKLLRALPGCLTCLAYSTVTRDLGLTSHPKD